MRDDRYSRANEPYDVDGRGYADDQGYGYQGGYGEQPSGFTRHQSSNSRRIATENPVVGAAKRVGGAVAGFVQSIGNKGASAVAARGPRPSTARTASHDGGDYLGAGGPCRVCGNPVGANQMRCPHCGAFVTPFYRNIAFWIAAVVLVALVVVLSIAINSCKPDGGKPSQDLDPTAISTENDKSALSAAVTSAKTTLEAQASAHAYTRYSLANLKNVVAQAETVLSDATATNERVSTTAQAVSDAIGALAGVVAEYPWPTYNDLVVNAAAYTGQQVAVNGTCQLVNVHEDGSVSAALAMSGDPACVIYVDYIPSDADGVLAVGLDFNAMGTVAGLADDGTPYMVADVIDIL